MTDGSSQWAEQAAIFDLFTAETRIGIVVELAARLQDDTDGPDLPFAELRRRVEGRETGNFSYHLEKLEGTLIERTDAGTYRLTARGAYLASVFTSGFYEPHDRRIVDTEFAPCPTCTDDLEVRHEGGLLRIECGNDHTAAKLLLPQNQLDQRSVDELETAATALAHQVTALARRGVCPVCHGPTAGSLSLEATVNGQPSVSYRCTDCGIAGFGPPGVFLLENTAVVAFLHEHGIDAREVPPWSPLLTDEEFIRTEIVDRTPPELRCTVRPEDELVLRFDVRDGRIEVVQ